MNASEGKGEGRLREVLFSRCARHVRALLRALSLPRHTHDVVKAVRSFIDDMRTILFVLACAVALAVSAMSPVIVGLALKSGIALLVCLLVVFAIWIARGGIEEIRRLNIIKAVSGHLSTEAQVNDAIEELKRTRTREQAEYMG